ncbi:RIIa domain-containing protein 1 [Polymixia lowei]
MSGKEGLEKLDVGALSAEQQEKLRRFKVKKKIDNEKYLRSHPEVEILISDFLREVFLKRPDDISEFSADHFTSPDLPAVIGAKMQGNSDGE